MILQSLKLGGGELNSVRDKDSLVCHQNVNLPVRQRQHAGA